MAASSADDHLTVGGDADAVVSADLEHLGNVPSTPSAQLGLLTAALSGDLVGWTASAAIARGACSFHLPAACERDRPKRLGRLAA